ncbi:hypothetical protein C8J56DRAFT_907207 [Mycena floridula]|nr:hypothetical protein C8J56DRAFT_907207 [Mycena floridula]
MKINQYQSDYQVFWAEENNRLKYTIPAKSVFTGTTKVPLILLKVFFLHFGQFIISDHDFSRSSLRAGRPGSALFASAYGLKILVPKPKPPGSRRNGLTRLGLNRLERLGSRGFDGSEPSCSITTDPYGVGALDSDDEEVDVPQVVRRTGLRLEIEDLIDLSNANLLARYNGNPKEHAAPAQVKKKAAEEAWEQDKANWDVDMMMY